MTENSIGKIIQEAQGRWQVMDCTVIHRYGELEPCDQIVLVASQAPTVATLSRPANSSWTT